MEVKRGRLRFRKNGRVVLVSITTPPNASVFAGKRVFIAQDTI